VEVVAVVKSEVVQGEESTEADAKTSSKNRIFPSLGEALSDAEAEGAIIAGPAADRGRQALEALRAGLGVLVETPLALTVREALEILKTARQSGKPVIVAQNSRYGWAESRLKDFVRQGRVGQVIQASFMDWRKQASEENWLTKTDHAQLLDKAIDHFDGIRSILGLNPVSLIAEIQNDPWSIYRHGSITQSMIELEQRVHVLYYGSVTSAQDQHETRVEGEKGVLWTDRKMVWWRKRGWPRFIPLLVKRPRASERQHRRRLLELMKGALQGRPIEMDDREVLWPIAMSEAVIQSAREGRPVEVASVHTVAGRPNATGEVSFQAGAKGN